MPTKAEFSAIATDMEALRLNFQEPCHSWTDDIPVCQLSGVGFSTNQKYRIDGFRREEHAFEDRSFHFRYDDYTYFYGVFDGHMGTKAADFAAQRMPAEVLLGQLCEKQNDHDVRDVLQMAFSAVEKGFFESIDDLLAEKENLRLQLQGLRTIEAIKQFPQVVERLKTVTEEIQNGTTAVVALVLHDKLYIANVGDSRALLCMEEENGKITICQLSPEHTFTNDDELLRLTQLGLNIDKLKSQYKTGLQNCTRCIGNYTVKGGHKEFDNFSESVEEPIIAEPDIVGGIKVDEKCKFLLLMSDGLYRSLEEATGIANANKMIVNMVMEQFSEQSTLNGVAQAVVDKVVRIHHDAFMNDNQMPKRCQKRDDITLLVRSFNFPVPNTVGSIRNNPMTLPSERESEFATDNVQSDNTDFLNTSFTSGSETGIPQALFQHATNVPLDQNGRIKPYVDFTEFYSEVKKAYANGEISEDWLTPST